MPDRPKIPDDVFAVVVKGYPKPLAKRFAECWPIGAFVDREPCGEHVGPCGGLHVSTSYEASGVRFTGETQCRRWLSILSAQYNHVTFEIVSYRRHVAGKEKTT